MLPTTLRRASGPAPFDATGCALPRALPRVLAALLALALCPAFLSAAPSPALPSLSSLLGEATMAKLAAGEKATRTDSRASLDLLPVFSAAARIREEVAAAKPGILVETVFAYRREAPTDEAGLQAERARIYGLMRSFSSLQGIEYYSYSRGKMRTLYAESWLVADDKAAQRLPDPASPDPAAIPQAERLFAWQKDLTFGGNIYQYDLSSIAEGLEVVSTNLTRMSYGFIPMIAPKGLVSRLIAIQASDGIVFYVESEASAPGIFQGRIGESFSNRAAALFSWFSDRFPKYK